MTGVRYPFYLRGIAILCRIYMRLFASVKPICRSVTSFGVVMDLDIRDFVPRRVHFFRVYEHSLTRVMEKHVRLGDSVIDVGANVGYFSLLAGSLVGPSGRVVAIEAAPVSFAKLTHNVRLNGFEDRIEMRPEAVTAAPCRVSLKIVDERNLGATKILVDDEGGVSGLPLTEIIGDRLRSVSFIKIDVEGAEGPILEDLLERVNELAPRLVLAVEVQEKSAHFISEFVGLGFEAFVVSNPYAIEHYVSERFSRSRVASELLPVDAFVPGQWDYLLLRNA